MRTIWQWLNAPVKYVGMPDGAIAMVAGGLIGWIIAVVVKWLIS